MQDDRQAHTLGELELLDIEMLLPHRIETRHEKVQTDLTHCHQLRVGAVRLKFLGQSGEIDIGRAHHVERMDAQRIGKAVPPGRVPCPCELVSLHGGDQHLGDARLACAVDDGTAVRVKFGRVEMAVGINPHCLGPSTEHDRTIAVQQHAVFCMPLNGTSQRHALHVTTDAHQLLG